MKDLDFALQVAKKTAFLMDLQEERGICFDRESGIILAEKIGEEMAEIEARIEHLLPEVPMNKGELLKEKVPSRRFKNDKSETHGRGVSLDMLKKYGEDSFYKDDEDHWCFSPLNCRVEDIPETYHMKTTRPFKLKDQNALKDYLMETHGWIPTLWNYQKDKNGKDIRDERTKQKIETTPKFHHQGDICENLILLGSKLDWLEDVVRWLSIKHKKSLLLGDDGEKGLCNNSRLDIDGRLSAGASGVSNTWRFKHKTVVNMPRPSSIYGKEIRGMFRAEDGKVIVGWDASSLEAFIKAHYCAYFDGGAYAAKISDPDFDEHRVNGMAWGLMKDENDKIGRQQTKGGTYCVPSYTEVLTNTGWVNIVDVSVGDTVVGYNESTGLQEYTTVTDTITIPSAKVNRYSVKNRAHFDCTENHRFIGDKVNWRGVYTPCSFEIKDVTHANRIRVTSKSNIGNTSLDKDLAEWLGWMLSEGTVKFSGFTRNKVQGVDASIAQKVGEFSDRIEHLTTRLGITYTKYLKGDTDVLCLSFHSQPFRDVWCKLFGQVGKHDVDWVSFVLSLDQDTLNSLFRGFYLGDGHMTIPRGEFRFNKFSQIKGKINEGMQLAAHLLGYRVAYRDIKSDGKPIAATSIGNNEFITCQRLKTVPIGEMDVHCLTTQLGSFVMRQGSSIMITGNCLQYNAMPPTLAKTIGVSLEDAKRFHEIYWEINWAWKTVNERLEVQWMKRKKKGILCPVTGAFLHITSKNILGSWTVQHTGAFVMDLAGCFMDSWLGGIQRDAKGRPCYLYKGREAARVGYMHDEYIWECDPEIAEELLELGIQSIIKAGEFLELKVPLSAAGAIGGSWGEVH